MQLNELFNIPGSKKKAKRVGRGMSSGLGKTSGRGVKGQKSRSGVAIKGFEGGQMPMIKRLPKRGFKSRSTNRYVPVNLSTIEYFIHSQKIKSGDLVDNNLLSKLGVIKNANVKVKLLGTGELSQKVVFSLDAYSSSVKEALKQYGAEIK